MILEKQKDLTRGIVMEKMITVCDHCLMASCWLGDFMCEDYQFAGTVEMTREELEELGLENPTFWNQKENENGLV